MDFVSEKEMARQLADQSANLNKNSHPLDISNETTRYRQRDESEERGGAEKWNPEELPDNGPDTPYEHSLNSPSKGGSHRRGGGISSRDQLLDDKERGDGDTIDPELSVMGPNIEDQRLLKKAKNAWSRRLELGRVGYDSPVYDRLMDLGKVWTDANTQITYVVGEQQSEDKIVFRNPRLKWRSKNQSDERTLSLGEMREVLKDSDINLSIARPRYESDRQFVNDLKHIRLGTGVLKGEKVRVEFSKVAQEKREEDKNFFNLKLNRKALERFTTSDDRKNVEDFVGLLEHAGQDEIEWMGYEMSRDGREITGVSLQERERDKIRNGVVVGKQGGPKEKYTISATVYRAIMENVFPHKSGDRSTGFEFKVPGGMQESVHPGMSAEQVAVVMKKVKIEGVALPENVKFFIGNDFQKS